MESKERMLGTCTEKLLWVTGKHKSNFLIEELCWAGSTGSRALFGHKMTDVQVNPVHGQTKPWKITPLEATQEER